MAALANVGQYSDALVVLGIAGVVVPLLSRFGLSPVLGYLGMGAALGPFGLGSLRGDLGLFHWLTISDAKGVAGIAELGVVFLLFMIGLELSYGRLQAMRRLVFGLGAAHASHLYEIGVTDAVPETVEASLQLSKASLVGLGLPAGPVIASIHEMRDTFRTELQNAARRSGRQITRSIRRKTLRDRRH